MLTTRGNVETENDLSIVLKFNIRCLSYHFEDCLAVPETLTPKSEILEITETWMTENDPSEEKRIDGYQPIVPNPLKEFK